MTLNKGPEKRTEIDQARVDLATRQAQLRADHAVKTRHDIDDEYQTPDVRPTPEDAGRYRRELRNLRKDEGLGAVLARLGIRLESIGEHTGLLLSMAIITEEEAAILPTLAVTDKLREELGK